MAVACGTFRRACVTPNQLHKVWFLMFVPVRDRRISLADATQIETAVEDRMDLETGLTMAFWWGILDALWISLLERIVDWGDYKLWVRLAPGQRVLVWQGNGEGNFRRNLKIMEDVFGLPVTRG